MTATSIMATDAAGAPLPRRGRPPACETARRDAYLLDVAEGLFLEHGFSQVSLARLAKSAGVATRTIYARFGNKQGMLERIIERRSGDRGLVKALAEPRLDPVAALRRLAAHAFDHALSTGSKQLSADVLAVRRSRAANGMHALHTGLWYDMLSEILGAGEWRLGGAPVADKSVVADLFIGCLLREHASGALTVRPWSSSGNAPDQATASGLAAKAVQRLLSVASWTLPAPETQTGMIDRCR